MTIPIINIGFAAIIIHEAVMSPSVKNERASRIFRLLSVERYRYVTKKFAELTIDALSAKNTPMRPTSTFPMVVNFVREEKGVTMAQPGIRSFEFRSMANTNESEFKKRLCKLC